MIEAPDWDAVLVLANEQLVTPRLWKARALLDPEVARFVDEVCARNRHRNDLLNQQLSVVVSALNAVGIIPLVIKGAALLVRQGPTALRMLSDLDIVVHPEEIGDAIAALQSEGFRIVARTDHLAAHGAATMERVGDVGQLDLHRRPPGPPSFVEASQFERHLEIVQTPSGTVHLPAPHLHIYFQALHDQLHDKSFWRASMDLRHAWDTAELAETYPIDWDALIKLAPSIHVANAVAAQLNNCQRLTGMRLPGYFDAAPHRLRARLHAWQWACPGWATVIFLAILLFEAPALIPHRALERRLRRTQGLPKRSSRWADNLRALIRP